MKSIDIEKLKQLISRTDISGNDKVRWLTDFIDGRELQQQERMYSEEEARIIWRAGQEYWKTSGDSITFEELTEKLKTKYPVKTKDSLISEISEETRQKSRDYSNSLIEGTFENINNIDDWSEKNNDPEIVKQVEQEAKELCKKETLEKAADRLFSTMPSEVSTVIAKEKAIELAQWEQEKVAAYFILREHTAELFKGSKLTLAKYFEQFKNK